MASLDNYWIICSVLILSTLFKQVYSACNPVEEGEDAVMDCEMTVTEGDSCLFRLFTWKAEVGTSFVTVGTCYPSACVNDSTDVSNVTIRKSGSVYTSELTIASVIRSDAIQDGSEWRCVADAGCGGRTVNACPSLEIYFLPENPTCGFEEVYNDLDGSLTAIKVTSDTSKVYPAADCLFYHNKNSVQLDNSIAVAGTMISEVSDNPVYYSYRCENIYPIQEIGEGNHTFYSRMYPNVTGGADLPGVVDTECGKIKLAFPTTETNCSQQDGYFPGRTISCGCSVKDQGYPEGRAEWYANGQEMEPSQMDQITITYDESDTDTKYACNGISSLGMSEGPTFSRQFAFVDANTAVVQIEKSESEDQCTQDTNISVVCSVPKENANPNVNMIFILSDENDNTVNSSQSQQAEINGSHFQSQHTFPQVAGGKYQVKCQATNIIFPNLTADSTPETTEIKGPPSDDPIITNGNKTYQSVSSDDVPDGFDGTLHCEVEGGSPPAENIAIHCISRNSSVDVTKMNNVSFEDNPLTYDLGWVECTCTADHESNCYSGRTAVTLTISAPSADYGRSDSSRSDVERILIPVLAAVAGLVIILIVVIVVYKKKKRSKKDSVDPQKMQNNGSGRPAYGGRTAEDDEVIIQNQVYISSSEVKESMRRPDHQPIQPLKLGVPKDYVDNPQNGQRSSDVDNPLNGQRSSVQSASTPPANMVDIPLQEPARDYDMNDPQADSGLSRL